MQSRWRSRTSWASIFALFIFVTKTYLKIEIPESDTLVMLVLSVLTAIGIFNNPTDKENY